MADPKPSDHLSYGWKYPGTRGEKAAHLDDVAIGEHFGSGTGEHVRLAGRLEDAGQHDRAARHLDSAHASVVRQMHGIENDHDREAARRLLGELRHHGSRNAARATQMRQAARGIMFAGGTGRTIDMGTYAHTPPGSGKNFAALKGTLAARGASDPGALAAWIGRRKYGRKRFAKLGAKGRSMSNQGIRGIQLASEEGSAGEIEMIQHEHMHMHNGVMHSHQHSHDVSDHSDVSEHGDGSSSGTSVPSAPSVLRTPANTDYHGRTGSGAQEITVRGGMVASGMANGRRRAVELARRMPVTGPGDIIVTRDAARGVAVIRHRQGGGKIGEVFRTDDGRWAARVEGGGDLTPHAQQRAALFELVGTHNQAAGTAYHLPSEPVQPPPQQTPLMQQFGIPAIRLATPANGSGDAPRMTTAGGSGADGLSPRAKSVYAKLCKRGMPAARALQFAKNSERFR